MDGKKQRQDRRHMMQILDANTRSFVCANIVDCVFTAVIYAAIK